MPRSLVIGARLLCVALLLALAGQAMQPAGALAAGETITLTPNAGPAGSSFTVTGSGFTGTSVTVYFNGTSLGTAAVMGGALTNATFTVPALPANNAYPVQVLSAAGLSNSANFTITPLTTALGNLILSKFVQTPAGYVSCGSTMACTTTNTPGATLTYAIQYQNTANAPIGTLTITDTLQAGQTFVSGSSGCVAGAASPTTGLVTVTCTVSNVPASPAAGSTSFVTITTTLASSFTGAATNQACATEAGFVGQACSNTTSVMVTTPSSFTGTTQICGAVTSYVAPTGGTAGSITIGGQTFTIAPNATFAGSAITTTAPSNNLCITFTFTNGIATALNVSPNLALVNVVCGVFTLVTPAPSATATATVTVGGVSYTATAVAMAGTSLVNGQVHCFLVQNGVIVGVLSGIPTSASAVDAGGIRMGRMLAY